MRDTTVALLETLKAVSIDATITKCDGVMESVAESPAKNVESVATIQPSIHEQVNTMFLFLYLENCRAKFVYS